MTFKQDYSALFVIIVCYSAFSIVDAYTFLQDNGQFILQSSNPGFVYLRNNYFNPVASVYSPLQTTPVYFNSDVRNSQVQTLTFVPNQLGSIVYIQYPGASSISGITTNLDDANSVTNLSTNQYTIQNTTQEGASSISGFTTNTDDVNTVNNLSTNQYTIQNTTQETSISSVISNANSVNTANSVSSIQYPNVAGQDVISNTNAGSNTDYSLTNADVTSYNSFNDGLGQNTVSNADVASNTGYNLNNADGTSTNSFINGPAQGVNLSPDIENSTYDIMSAFTNGLVQGVNVMDANIEDNTVNSVTT